MISLKALTGSLTAEGRAICGENPHLERLELAEFVTNTFVVNERGALRLKVSAH